MVVAFSGSVTTIFFAKAAPAAFAEAFLPAATWSARAGERSAASARLFVNVENLSDVRQTSREPLVRPSPGPLGVWTVDAWGPLSWTQDHDMPADLRFDPLGRRHVLLAPDDCTINRAVRWGQLRGMEVPERIARGPSAAVSLPSSSGGGAERPR